MADFKIARYISTVACEQLAEIHVYAAFFLKTNGKLWDLQIEEILTQ